jgi:hypothetical protein
MSTDRQGERLGWTLGWAGSFLWVVILAAVNLARGAILITLVGVALVAAAAILVHVLSPWRHPTTRYWRLMAPVYVLFFASFAWASWSAGGIAELGLSVWSLFLLLPLLMPFYLAGNRRWIDGEHPAS